jgi:transcriptional regulator with XRE-family HTH domain
VAAPGAPAGDGRPYDPDVADDGDERVCRTFGAWVRELRQRKKLTQTDVAQRAGISLTYVSEIERGIRNPTLAVIVRLARALDATPSQLVARLDRVE